MRHSFLSTLAVGAAAFFFSLPNVYAQLGSRGSKTITTAAPFLLIGPDSRAGGMGEAGVAIADDANATHWNPAGLAFIDGEMGFSLSYSPWLRSLNIPDINLAYLSGYKKAGKNGTLGASLRYFSLGTIEYTGENAEPLGDDRPSEFALDAAYALKVTPDLSASISLRYFYSRLATDVNICADCKPVSSVAGDMSFLYKKDFKIRNPGADLPVTFSSGLVISNIGPKVSYSSTTSAQDYIPINLRLGYAFKFQVDEYNSVTFANDFNKLMVPSEGGRSDLPLLQGMFGSFSDAPGGIGEEISEFTTSIGLEYWYRGLFAARLGYFYEDPAKGNRKFITLGAGLKYKVFGVNFSYLAPLEQQHPLANTLRFSLTYDFDSEGND